MGSFIVVKLNLYPEGWTSSIPIFSLFGSPCSNHCSYSQGCSLDRERLSLQTVSGRFLNVSVSSWYCHSNVSVSTLQRLGLSLVSVSRLNVSVSSWSWHYTSHLQPSESTVMWIKKPRPEGRGLGQFFWSFLYISRCCSMVCSEVWVKGYAGRLQCRNHIHRHWPGRELLSTFHHCGLVFTK